MALTSTSTYPGYDATLEGVTLFPRPDANSLRISGEDRLDYLQRQTTNDLNLLAPERALLTVLTSPTARILDVFLLVAEPETIGVITLPGRGQASARFLQGRIFFMDKVAVADVSAEFAQLDLEGPDVAASLRRAGLAKAPALDEVVSAHIDGVGVRVIGRKGLVGSGYRLLAPAAASETLTEALTDAGASLLAVESYELLRVEAGLPGHHELTEDYTPLEANLRTAVSDSKGCYTGQEVIARQLTYDKVTRRLVGLRLDAPVTLGAKVMAGGKSIGSVTSAVQSPRYGPIALAFVKRRHNEPGSAVTVSGEEDSSTDAEVSPLPFQPQR